MSLLLLALLAADVDFARDIQPLFAARCYGCHGEDAQEGNLRLDRRDNGLRVLRPGDPDKSRLQQLVVAKKMPSEGEPLSESQIGLLRDWIRAGAIWPESKTARPAIDGHWSFRPIVRPPRSDIDSLIRAKLRSVGLQPSPPASRATLIRRLSLDLLGLPPTPDEVAAFIANDSPTAYRELIDRYLASPHFGERWSRHWLDRARFGETSGCVSDMEYPYAWRWRDWVIRSLNADQPFDQFTLEQLAGDLLPRATIDQQTATGFHRLAIENHEGGTNIEGERVKTTVDRTNAVGMAWLGLTLGCAECHSHKYDPITQDDFYRLFAFFNNVESREIDAGFLGDAPRFAKLRADVAEREAVYAATLAPGQADWERSVLAQPDIWRLPENVEPSVWRSDQHAFLKQFADGSYLARGRLASGDSYELNFPAPPAGITAVKFEVLADPERFHRGPGRGSTNLFGLSRVLVEAEWPTKPNDFERLPLETAFADYCQAGFRPEGVLDTDSQTGWGTDQIAVPHAMVVVLKDAPAGRGASRMRFYFGQHIDAGRQAVRFRVAYTTVSREQIPAQPVPQAIVDLVRIPFAKRTANEAAQVKRYFQSVADSQSPELAGLNAALLATAEELTVYGAHAIAQLPQPRQTFVHIRGDFQRHGKPISPGMIAAFSKSNAAASDDSSRYSTRVELAQWLTDRSNPLTARVQANDIWQHLFGHGLVRTPNDFGRQGEPPTHPELLDWLADEFMRLGWSRKELIREIVLSETYQQSSVLTDELRERDPKNLLLARQHRFRLEAETIRDVTLASVELLNRQVGGRSFRTDGPEDKPWRYRQPKAAGDDLFRRGLYAFSARTAPFDTLATFDAPGAEASCTQRQRTNTPLQSLTLLNEPVYVQSALALARRLADSPAPAEGISRAFSRCLLRIPSPGETDSLLALWESSRKHFAEHPEDAAKLLGEPSTKTNAASADFAAWFVVARTVLNTDELMNRP